MALYNCKEAFTDVMKTLQNKLFMQNKANFQKVKLNVTEVLTTDYDQMDTWSIGKTKPIKANSKPIKANSNPIQSQSKPIQSQFKAKFKKAKMNITAALTKEYENKSNWAICENEPNLSRRSLWRNRNKPNFSQFQTQKTIMLFSIMILAAAIIFLEFGVLVLTTGQKSRILLVLYFPVLSD
jgi:ABC-type lipoprotein release transport system permease subunit